MIRFQISGEQFVEKQFVVTHRRVTELDMRSKYGDFIPYSSH